MGEQRPGVLEWAGWGLLAVVTTTTIALAVFRPTDPSAVLSQIRLAAGFDRYQAAIDDGDRLFSRAVADGRMRGGTPQPRAAEYAMLERAAARFIQARREAEGFAEDAYAQERLGQVYYVWARGLHADATGAWYERNDRDMLARAREIAERGLALPAIDDDQRREMARLKTRIDRAITPWPIL